jgi:hypothetical protein
MGVYINTKETSRQPERDFSILPLLYSSIAGFMELIHHDTVAQRMTRSWWCGVMSTTTLAQPLVPLFPRLVF